MDLYVGVIRWGRNPPFRRIFSRNPPFCAIFSWNPTIRSFLAKIPRPATSLSNWWHELVLLDIFIYPIWWIGGERTRVAIKGNNQASNHYAHQENVNNLKKYGQQVSNVNKDNNDGKHYTTLWLLTTYTMISTFLIWTLCYK